MVTMAISAMKPAISEEMRTLYRRSHEDWNYFAEKILNVNLDAEQKRILSVIQHEPRVSIRSGNSRGKDYLAAVASNCWLHLYNPSKVISTAPSGRQVEAIMMSEIKDIRAGARIPLGGRTLSTDIKFDDDPEHFLIAFKASDTRDEVWTGFHSPNIMVVVSEASGIEDRTFTNIEKVLQGNSKLLIVFNALKTYGEAYRSINDRRYTSIRMNCLEAPNVLAKKIIYPGQVDWNWINNLVQKPGMVKRIAETEVRADLYDFQWEGTWCRPGDLFRVMVIGEPPADSEDQLIPSVWVDMAFDRWRAQEGKKRNADGALRLGVDVAGMGRDSQVMCFRYGSTVTHFTQSAKSEHMATVGKIKTIEVQNPGSHAFIDTIGEGSGVYSRAKELNLAVTSAKFSNGAKGLKDLTGIREFLNMRAYCYWAVRDALDPAFDDFRAPLALPPDEDLKQELCAHRHDLKSGGHIYILEKDEVKEVIGRSPDKSDALALSYFKQEQRPRVRMI
jgi:hypothetical protein